MVYVLTTPIDSGSFNRVLAAKNTVHRDVVIIWLLMSVLGLAEYLLLSVINIAGIKKYLQVGHVLWTSQKFVLLANYLADIKPLDLVGYGGSGVQNYGFVLFDQAKRTLATHSRYLAEPLATKALMTFSRSL